MVFNSGIDLILCVEATKRKVRDKYIAYTRYMHVHDVYVSPRVE